MQLSYHKTIHTATETEVFIECITEDMDRAVLTTTDIITTSIIAITTDTITTGIITDTITMVPPDFIGDIDPASLLPTDIAPEAAAAVPPPSGSSCWCWPFGTFSTN